MSPLVSHIYELGLAEGLSIGPRRTEGMSLRRNPPTPAAAIREAKSCRDSRGKGHSHAIDLGLPDPTVMVDADLEQRELDKAMEAVPEV